MLSNRVADLISDDTADANPTGLRQGFEPGRDVHPVTKDVVLFNDNVAQVDANAESDPPLFGHFGSRSIIPRWISAAQRTASTTLANSARKPSPVFFTIRPLCSLIFGSRVGRDGL
jgi:hypothetical protein